MEPEMKIRNLARHSRGRKHRQHMAKAQIHLELAQHLAAHDAPAEVVMQLLTHTYRDHLRECGCPEDSWPKVALDLYIAPRRTS